MRYQKLNEQNGSVNSAIHMNMMADFDSNGKLCRFRLIKIRFSRATAQVTLICAKLLNC